MKQLPMSDKHLSLIHILNGYDAEDCNHNTEMDSCMRHNGRQLGGSAD